MPERLFLIANEEYLSSQSGGGNDIKSDLFALRKIFDEVIIISLSRNSKNAAIDKIKKGIDPLFFSGFLSFERFFSQATPSDYRDNKRITNIKDLHFFRELRSEMLSGDSSGNHKHIMERELTVYKYSDLVLSYSDDETRLIKKINPEINIKKHYYYNPNFSTRNNFKYNKKLIFIGNFEHKPNLDAILNFDKEYTFDSSEFSFEIFGQHSLEKLKNHNTKNKYNIIGAINDPAECYSQGGLFVSPIRFGGGIKIKIIEAALSRLPIVATPESIEGLNLSPNKSYIPLTTNAEFQRTLVEFKEESPYIQEIADAAQNSIRNISNEEVVYKNLAALIPCS